MAQPVIPVQEGWRGQLPLGQCLCQQVAASAACGGVHFSIARAGCSANRSRGVYPHHPAQITANLSITPRGIGTTFPAASRRKSRPASTASRAGGISPFGTSRGALRKASWRGRGLGSALLADALRRCLAASEIAGVRGVVAPAIDEDAARLYEVHGFVRSPLGERVMLMGIETVRGVLGAEAS